MLRHYKLDGVEFPRIIGLLLQIITTTVTLVLVFSLKFIDKLRILRVLPHVLIICEHKLSGSALINFIELHDANENLITF